MYNKILVAIDLSKDTDKVFKAALRMANGESSKLNLVHVVEPILLPTVWIFTQLM